MHAISTIPALEKIKEHFFVFLLILCACPSILCTFLYKCCIFRSHTQRRLLTVETCDMVHNIYTVM